MRLLTAGIDWLLECFGGRRRERLLRIGTGEGEPDFPLFVSLRGVDVLIAGGGKVAERRAETLLGFGARVHVVAPEAVPALAGLAERGALRWSREEYRPEHLAGAALAVAATDRREVNRRIGQDAGERGILVSVADERRECTFYFPAIVRSGRLVAGLVSNNGDHALVSRAAARLREEMEAIDANDQGGEPREPSGPCPDRAGHGRDTQGASRRRNRAGAHEDLGRPDS